MPFKKCVDNLLKNKEIDKQKADEMNKLFDMHISDYQNSMHPDMASQKAADDVLEELRITKALKKKQQLLNIAVQARINKIIDSSDDPIKAAKIMFDGTGYSLKNPDLYSREAHIRGRTEAMMSEFLANHSRNLKGETRDKANILDMVRELFAEDTGNKYAKEIAGSWQHASGYLRGRFNMAGGHIAKKKNWGLPQSHDASKVGSVPFDEWRAFILPKLDSNNMVDGLTGKAFNPERLELALREVYDNIRTEGYSKLNPHGIANVGAIANKRTDHRFLEFKNADDWLAYQEKFGNDNPFNIMVTHMHSMAREIALMEQFGPNPNITIRMLQQKIKKHAYMKGDNILISKANITSNLIERQYKDFTGASFRPEREGVAAFAQGTRNLLISAQLGSAAISALSDIVFVRMSAKMNGLSVSKHMRNVVKLLNPKNIEDRKFAVSLGLQAEEWAKVAGDNAKFIDQISGPEWTRRVADGVMRVTLLSPWTQAGRHAFGLNVLNTLAENAHLPFNKLNDGLQKGLSKYGLEGEVWDVIRKTKAIDYQGSKYFKIEDIANRADLNPIYAEELALRISTLISKVTELGVPTSSPRARAILGVIGEPGTITGEVARSGLMYKGFALGVISNQLATMSEMGFNDKANYIANLILSTTIMGGFAYQLKEIAKGNDPMPMDNADFWKLALLQGGGLGIYGDFLFKDTNRYGFTYAETVAGPGVQLLADVGKLTFGNISQIYNGDDPKMVDEFATFIGKYAPGSNMWFIRAPVENAFVNQLRLWNDPKANRKIKRRAKFLKERGQGQWYGGGSALPNRSPNFANALGE